jgi:hypothetical protein
MGLSTEYYSPYGLLGVWWWGSSFIKRLFSELLRNLPAELFHIRFVSLADIGSSDWRSFPADSVIFNAIYLDDLSLFGTDAQLLDSLLSSRLDGYEQMKIPVERSKTVRPCTALRVLGVWLARFGGGKRATRGQELEIHL